MPRKKRYSKETFDAKILSVFKSFPRKTLNIKHIYIRLGAHTLINRVITEKSLRFLCNNKTLIKILIK